MTAPRQCRTALVVLAPLVIGAGAGIWQPAPASASNPIAEAFPLIFDAEWVRLDVEGDNLEVRGTFLLLCREPIEESIPLFFPFPRDSLLGEARMVSLRFRVAGDSGSPGRWEEVPGNPGVRWWMPPCRGDSLVAEFVYRQELREKYARYIVTSARLWGRPLRYAAFEIRLPPGVEPLDFSYPFERLELTRSRGHLTLWVGGFHDGETPRTVPAGVPPAHDRAGSLG